MATAKAGLHIAKISTPRRSSSGRISSQTVSQPLVIARCPGTRCSTSPFSQIAKSEGAPSFAASHLRSARGIATPSHIHGSGASNHADAASDASDQPSPIRSSLLNACRRVRSASVSVSVVLPDRGPPATTTLLGRFTARNRACAARSLRRPRWCKLGGSGELVRRILQVSLVLFRLLGLDIAQDRVDVLHAEDA